MGSNIYQPGRAAQRWIDIGLDIADFHERNDYRDAKDALRAEELEVDLREQQAKRRKEQQAQGNADRTYGLNVKKFKEQLRQNKEQRAKWAGEGKRAAELQPERVKKLRAETQKTLYEIKLKKLERSEEELESEFAYAAFDEAYNYLLQNPDMDQEGWDEYWKSTLRDIKMFKADPELVRVRKQQNEMRYGGEVNTVGEPRTYVRKPEDRATLDIASGVSPDQASQVPDLRRELEAMTPPVPGAVIDEETKRQYIKQNWVEGNMGETLRKAKAMAKSHDWTGWDDEEKKPKKKPPVNAKLNSL